MKQTRVGIVGCGGIAARDGAIGSIEASWTSPGSANIIEVYGTDGALIIDYTQAKIRFLATNSGDWQEIENFSAGPVHSAGAALRGLRARELRPQSG